MAICRSQLILLIRLIGARRIVNWNCTGLVRIRGVNTIGLVYCHAFILALYFYQGETGNQYSQLFLGIIV